MYICCQTLSNDRNKKIKSTSGSEVESGLVLLKVRQFEIQEKFIAVYWSSIMVKKDSCEGSGMLLFRGLSCLASWTEVPEVSQFSRDGLYAPLGQVVVRYSLWGNMSKRVKFSLIKKENLTHFLHSLCSIQGHY